MIQIAATILDEPYKWLRTRFGLCNDLLVFICKSVRINYCTRHLVTVAIVAVLTRSARNKEHGTIVHNHFCKSLVCVAVDATQKTLLKLFCSFQLLYFKKFVSHAAWTSPSEVRLGDQHRADRYLNKWKWTTLQWETDRGLISWSFTHNSCTRIIGRIDFDFTRWSLIYVIRL